MARGGYGREAAAPQAPRGFTLMRQVASGNGELPAGTEYFVGDGPGLSQWVVRLVEVEGEKTPQEAPAQPVSDFAPSASKGPGGRALVLERRCAVTGEAMLERPGVLLGGSEGGVFESFFGGAMPVQQAAPEFRTAGGWVVRVGPNGQTLHLTLPRVGGIL